MYVPQLCSQDLNRFIDSIAGRVYDGECNTRPSHPLVKDVESFE